MHVNPRRRHTRALADLIGIADEHLVDIYHETEIDSFLSYIRDRFKCLKLGADVSKFEFTIPDDYLSTNINISICKRSFRFEVATYPKFPNKPSGPVGLILPPSMPVGLNGPSGPIGPIGSGMSYVGAVAGMQIPSRNMYTISLHGPGTTKNVSIQASRGKFVTLGRQSVELKWRRGSKKPKIRKFAAYVCKWIKSRQQAAMVASVIES